MLRPPTARQSQVGASDSCAEGEVCGPGGLEGVTGGNREALIEGAMTRLPAEEVCADAGYLCEGLRQRGDLRIVRWDLQTEEIHIRVPRPEHEDSELARQLQAAAIAGILTWQNRPFPLHISRSDRPGDEDFAVVWSSQLADGELGHARTQWSRRGEVSGMRVEAFALATRSPWDAERKLTYRQIQLTAAHEMGHALGLPHSDSERDLMYPTNTASRLSPQDFYTMEALYRLENGAEVILPDG